MSRTHRTDRPNYRGRGRVLAMIRARSKSRIIVAIMDREMPIDAEAYTDPVQRNDWDTWDWDAWSD